ncbi:MAG: hydrolase [Anaerotignum sp.]|nr:hydrolase [Anaerotignum sp.]MDY3927418.1 hydrolase [Anaerotignum sp.]
MPEEIYAASGIVIMGRRIKSLIFSTDIAIIRNCNADAVLAVYPFTPQQIIADAIVSTSSLPVFCGVGGGTTTGARVVMLAKDAEALGAMAVVVNAPTSNTVIEQIARVVDIPIVVTVLDENTDIDARLEAGTSILNVSAAARTPEVVRIIRERYPDVPIIATGGPSRETIRQTVEAGANAISFTPPTAEELFHGLMTRYRNEHESKTNKAE